MYDFYSFIAFVLPLFLHVYLFLSPTMCETAINVSVEFQIRGQIVATELSTCLSTGWIPVFHIDPS